jgi:hypothetical protein
MTGMMTRHNNNLNFAILVAPDPTELNPRPRGMENHIFPNAAFNANTYPLTPRTRLQSMLPTLAAESNQTNSILFYCQHH